MTIAPRPARRSAARFGSRLSTQARIPVSAPITDEPLSAQGRPTSKTDAYARRIFGNQCSSTQADDRDRNPSESAVERRGRLQVDRATLLRDDDRRRRDGGGGRRAVEAQGARRPPARGVRDLGRDAPRSRLACAPEGAAPGRRAAPLPRATRRVRSDARVRGAPDGHAGSGGSRRAPACDEGQRDQGPDPERPPGAPPPPSGSRQADPPRSLGRHRGDEGPDRHPVHPGRRCLLAVRARPGGRFRGRPRRPPASQEAAGHLGAHRPEARRVHPGPGRDDHPRLHPVLDRVRARRRAVLAPARHRDRDPRDRPGRRAGGSDGARRRCRPDRVMARCGARGRRAARPAARAGLPDLATGARRSGGAAAARRPHLRVRDQPATRRVLRAPVRPDRGTRGHRRRRGRARRRSGRGRGSDGAVLREGSVEPG